MSVWFIYYELYIEYVTLIVVLYDFIIFIFLRILPNQFISTIAARGLYSLNCIFGVLLMKNLLITAIGVALATTTLLSGVAHATTEVEIAISGAGDPTSVFFIDTNPTPVSFSNGGYFRASPVSQTTDGAANVDSYIFYNSAHGGGLDDYHFGNKDYLLVAHSPIQLYSGSERDPTFVRGVYTGYTNALDGNKDTVTVSAAFSAIPELSTWSMMLAGFAAIGFAGYRRKAVSFAC
jgi:hypothetical protein